MTKLGKPQSAHTLNSFTFPYVYNRNTSEQSEFYYFVSFSDTLPLVPKPAIEKRCFEFFIDSFLINIIDYKFDTILKYICMIEILYNFWIFLAKRP